MPHSRVPTCRCSPTPEPLPLNPTPYVSSMPSIPSIGEQYANAASYAREKGVVVDGDQETFGQRLTEVLCAQLYAICVKIMVYNIGKLLDKCEPARSVSYARGALLRAGGSV